jgi:hypothetical protein
VILFTVLRTDYSLMMLSCLGTLKRIMKYLEGGVEAKKTSKDIQVKREAQSNSSSSLTQPPGPAYSKRTPRTNTNSIFDSPHMHGKIIS